MFLQAGGSLIHEGTMTTFGWIMPEQNYVHVNEKEFGAVCICLYLHELVRRP